jgi:hypothetical protein
VIFLEPSEVLMTASEVAAMFDVPPGTCAGKRACQGGRKNVTAGLPGPGGPAQPGSHTPSK